MLVADLLGPGRVWLDGNEYAGFPNHQAGAVLSYLLLNRNKRHPREQLATLFWYDRSSPAARKYLRNTIWKLRGWISSSGKNPDAFIQVESEFISIPKTANLKLDTIRFEQLCAQGEGAESRLTVAQFESLEQAMPLYQGDLLDGSYFEWCFYERERLRLIYEAASRQLTVHAGLSGDYPRAIDLAGQLLSIDPTRERIHRLLIAYYWASGYRSQAIAQYRRCKQILHGELGIEPLEATQNLNVQMMANRVDLSHWLDPQRQPPHLYPSSSAPRATGNVILRRLNKLRLQVEAMHSDIAEIESLLEPEPSRGDAPAVWTRRPRDA